MYVCLSYIVPCTERVLNETICVGLCMYVSMYIMYLCMGFVSPTSFHAVSMHSTKSVSAVYVCMHAYMYVFPDLRVCMYVCMYVCM
jgi:hypothetical protein